MSLHSPSGEMRIVHLARRGRIPAVWTADFVAEIGRRGPATMRTETADLSDGEVAAIVRDHHVAIVGWDARPLPTALADDPGELAYICCYSGTIRPFVPRRIVEAGLPVSNWGDLPAPAVAEAAMTLLLTCVHDMPVIRRAQADGESSFDRSRTGTLRGLSVGIVGLGAIARHFVTMARPFGARLLAFDPYATDVPADIEVLGSLEELCERSEALVIHAGLSDETSGMVRAEHLARLPDGGIVVNTARGAIIDQEALFAELASGRLRAGLDVLDDERPGALPAHHPLRQADNVTFTFHQLTDESGDPWPVRPGLTPLQQRVIDQLDRVAAGEQPHWVFDLDRYDRST